LHPQDLVQVGQEVQLHALSHDQTWEQHYRVLHADGCYRHVYDFSVAVRDDAGHLCGVRGYLLDVSAQKEAEQTLRQTSSLLACVLDAATGIAIIATDLNGTITVFNRGAEAMFGYPAIAMIGVQTPVQIHDPAQIARRSAELERELGRSLCGIDVFVETGRLHDGDAGEWTYIRRDGSSFTGALNVTPMLRDDGVLQGYLGVIRDVTRVREHEEALKQARERAEAANVAKSVFLANMSHEIRTPMNGVIGMTSLLLDTELSEEQRKAACIIQSSAESLLGIINDILDFSKIEAGKLEFENVNFSFKTVVDDCFAVFAHKAQEKGLQLHGEVDADVPTFLCGDPGRLRQILTNLISNAIKFTEQGQVRVRVALLWQDARMACLRCCVKDTGIGIPAERRAELFHSFSQLDPSTTRKYGGTGLGLAISQQLVALMGGEMTLESEEGQGSEFCFTVHLGVCQSTQQDTPESRFSQERCPARVLVAEDNPLNRKIVLAMLVKLGVEVVTVENGRQALAALEKDEFDLVLMDVQMPEMDGLEATRRIRDPASAVRHHDIPVIALTANAMTEDRLQCSKAGMNDHLAKPLTVAALTQTLLRWLPDQAAGISAM
jgi:PAS domain S-box-containing protein